jgi:S-adenosylmethionine-diacylglycerol 3-amino-3-carboxypropyl transferase
MRQPANLTKRTVDCLRYGVVWEDAHVLCEALRPVAKGGTLLSVASAGDNTLSLLTLDPQRVIAVDISAAQLAALALRVGAIATLSDSETRHFLGTDGIPDIGRLTTYDRIRQSLSPSARAFWDARPDDICRGVIHAGRFERYLRFFRRCILPLSVPRAAIRQILLNINPREKEHIYDTRWDTWRWRLACRLFFSSAVLSQVRFLGTMNLHRRSPGSELHRRARRVLTQNSFCNNPYLTYLFCGRYADDALPLYLQTQSLAFIRPRLSRLTFVHGSAADISASAHFVGMNLSDIFESVQTDRFEDVYRRLFASILPGGRMAYWSHFVPQTPPAGMGLPLVEEADRLYASDRICSYGSFHIDYKPTPFVVAGRVLGQGSSRI